MSSFRCTLGKALLSTKICYREARILSYPDALKRSFLVMSTGMLFCLPILYIIPLIISYFNLKKFKESTWDTKLGTNL
ncbi:MAG: hypothetical protein LBR98_05150 [Syntrophomonadaceae bacterium]|nr:hypothetical protein [Syntrophomonadaceae bacterium]